MSDCKPYQVVFMLREKDVSLQELSARNGLHASTYHRALTKPYEAGERAIAAALGVHPKEIWPSRYDTAGNRLKPQPRENYYPNKHKPVRETNRFSQKFNKKLTTDSAVESIADPSTESFSTSTTVI